MKNLIQILITAILLVGCASAGDPISPENNSHEINLQTALDYGGPYRLWGEWTFYFNAEHDQVDAVPKRNAQLHLNATKFLEVNCIYCLKITSIKNNGDGTIDMNVMITHPFPGMPQYTGFDVKGIIMFQGSHEFGPRKDKVESGTKYKYPYGPEEWRTSWRLLGDPEVLNPDGYTYRWIPDHDVGDLPVFKYYPGKYSNGKPTSMINAYKNFYSMEERHIFETDKSVIRTYHISLPPGPVVAGYAIEACWEPPIKTPVTNPVEDFPYSANQPEAYHFNIVINDGEPITLDNTCCLPLTYTVKDARAELDFWYYWPDYFGQSIETQYIIAGHFTPGIGYGYSGYPIVNCDGPDNWYCILPAGYPFWTHNNGVYQFIGFGWYNYAPPSGYDHVYPLKYPAVTLYEVVVDMN